MNRTILAALLLLPLLALPPAVQIAPAHAAPGHDHGDSPAAPARAITPRFAVTGEHFELAGRLKGETLVLWLDRAADNSPVTQADIHVETDKIKAVAKPAADGTFEIALPGIARLDRVALAFTVESGKDADLLAADLVLHEALDDAHGHAEGEAHDSRWYWIGAAAALLALFAVAAMLRGRRRAGEPRGELR